MRESVMLAVRGAPDRPRPPVFGAAGAPVDVAFGAAFGVAGDACFSPRDTMGER